VGRAGGIHRWAAPDRHNKIMLIDGATVVTGSLIHHQAEESNAENLLIIQGSRSCLRPTSGTSRCTGALGQVRGAAGGRWENSPRRNPESNPGIREVRKIRGSGQAQEREVAPIVVAVAPRRWRGESGVFVTMAAPVRWIDPASLLLVSAASSCTWNRAGARGDAGAAARP